ncbi:MAG: hypothetical protein WD232_04680 [Acidimicrobiales bacterium]
MSLGYLLLALAILIVGLVALAVVALTVAEWIRWLTTSGPVALVPLALLSATLVNLALPRPCMDGAVPDRQRPLTAAIDSSGECQRMGRGQVAFVPLAAAAGSLLAARAGLRGRRRG